MNRIEVAAGIDIGGTNTAFGFVDKQGNILYESVIPSNGNLPADDLIQRLFHEISLLLKEKKSEINLRGIGIGAPNANYFSGRIENPPNLNWGVVDIAELFKDQFLVPCSVTNDANASAIGEMIFGAARGIKDFIVITLGTGLGSGIVVNGKLVYGSDGFAGEIGHTIYDPNGRECGCGRKGCLETYVSATGIKRTVFELLAKSNKPSMLRSVSFNELNSKMIFDSALAGDKIALDAFDYTAQILGIKLADAIAHTSPEAVILFGGLALSGDLLLLPLKKYIEENLFHVFRGHTKVMLSELTAKNSGVLGAAALMWNELESMPLY